MHRSNTKVTLGKGAEYQAKGGKGIYDLVNLDGGGRLVELIKEKKHDVIDDAIRASLKPYLNSDGNERTPLTKILEIRQKGGKEENSDIGKKGRYECRVSPTDNYSNSDVKFVCHKEDMRGGVMETPLHVCILNRSELHNELAKRMLRIYPKLIYDFYISLEFYGENVLHMVIANGDLDMLNFFLQHIDDLKRTESDNEVEYIKAFLNQRAYGTFFLPADQAKSCAASLTEETLILSTNTNYDGIAYYGEYPLLFAASLGRVEMLQRLLKCEEVDATVQDMNGCTLLHMLVIHDKKELFEKLFDQSVNKEERLVWTKLLHVKNKQNLTPLTLAAKLARIEMYDLILEQERQKGWTYGDVSSAAYPVRDIDSISEKDGSIDPHSAMYQIVYGDEPNHTRMMSSVVGHILDEKWNHFAKWRLWRRAILFFLYFALALGAFYLRPAQDPDAKKVSKRNNNQSEYKNSTVADPCYLNNIHDPRHEAIIRLVLEGCVVAGTVIYFILNIMEIHNQGIKMFAWSVWRCTPKMVFLFSNCFLILIIPGRAACSNDYDNVLSILAILTIAPYFLFFLSAWEIIGTFVIMIYRMIRKDLLKFLCIYLIFVIGFSQVTMVTVTAMYLMFRGVQSTVFDNWFDALIAMFVMSLGEFGDIYDTFDNTPYPLVPKAMFLVYMIVVTLLMINLLIAMMGDTYTTVRERWETGEWLKERANIILVLEQAMSPSARLTAQLSYCSNIHFTQDDLDPDPNRQRSDINEASNVNENKTEATEEDRRRRAFIYRWHHTEKEKSLMKQKR